MRRTMIVLFAIFFLSGASVSIIAVSCSKSSSGKNVLPQLTDENNWHIYDTYDKNDVSQLLMMTDVDVSGIQKTHRAANLEAITTYSASGLVYEWFDRLFVDNDYLVAANPLAGFSLIKLSDIKDPRGKVVNYRGREGSDASLRFGCSGFSKRSSDGKIFAWFGHDIVDVLNTSIVCNSAPDFTHGTFSCAPKDRFVFDENDNLWIGTSNLDSDGTLGSNETYDANGLFKIASSFSGRSTVLADTAVWNIFKDTSQNIWISTNKGIYKRVMGNDTPALVYDSASSGKYAEQLFEFGGEVYAILKNFFHNPNPVSTRVFELHRWNSTLFEKVCDISSGSAYSGAWAFEFGGELYIKVDGALLKFNGVNVFTAQPAIGEDMGDYWIIPSGVALFSTGNMTGVSVYNFEGDGNTVRLTAVNTAESLVADNIHSLYSDSSGSMFIGPEASGFNVFSNNTFAIHELENEIIAVGFFQYNGKIYIQGALNLYCLENDQLQFSAGFPTNGENIYFDDDAAMLWAYPNWGAGYGGIAVLNMVNGAIKGTKDNNGNDYWTTDVDWSLDRDYHFYSVIGIPGDNAVFIAVGEDESIYPPLRMPYVLRYDYGSDTFTKAYLPDGNSEGIRAFATDGNVVYGASRQKLFRYISGKWEEYCDIQLGNDFRGMKAAGNYLFIISGWNSSGDGSSGGLEVVDLEARASTHYDAEDIPLPTNAIFAIEVQKLRATDFRLWLGTFNGLAYCDLDLTDGN